MKFSIVIPIYNAEKFLKKTLDCFLKCENYDAEVIMIDDGSSDHSANICKEYAKKNHNFKYFYETNAGNTFAKNYGIEKSIGEYIVFCDHDDFFDIEALKYFNENFVVADLYEFKVIAKSKQGVYISGYRKNFLSENMGTTLENFHGYNTLLGVSGNIYRRNIILKNNVKFEDVTYYDDFNFNCVYLHFCDKVMFYDYASYTYFAGNSFSISNNYKKNLLDATTICLANYKKLIEKYECWDVEKIVYYQTVYELYYAYIFNEYKYRLFDRNAIEIYDNIFSNTDNFKGIEFFIPRTLSEKIYLYLLKTKKCWLFNGVFIIIFSIRRVLAKMKFEKR